MQPKSDTAPVQTVQGWVQACANGAGLGLALIAGLAFGCHDDPLALLFAALSFAPVILFLAWRA